MAQKHAAEGPFIVLILGILNIGNIPPVLKLLGYRPGTFPFPFQASGIDNPLQQLLTTLTVILAVMGLCIALLQARRTNDERQRSWGLRSTTRLPLYCGISIIALTLLLPQLFHALIRVRTNNISYTHDGGCLYIEEATRFLVHGIDPYERSYHGTVVETKFRTDPFWRTQATNHILDHNPYLPGLFLVTAPLLSLAEALDTGYDQRYLYFLLWLVVLALYPRLFPQPDRLKVMALFFLNPAVSMYSTQGTIDVLLYVTLFWYFTLARRGRNLSAAMVLGLACTFKQFAWFFVPFHVAYTLGVNRRIAWSWRTLVRPLLPIPLVCGLVFLPFLLSAPKAFIEDALLFNFGLLGRSYPFGGTPGYGIANLLLAFGAVKDVNHEFPMIVFQAPVFAVGLWFAYRLWKRPNLNLVSLGFAVTTLLYLMASRMFHYSYLGFLITFIIVSLFMESPEPEQRVLSATQIDKLAMPGLT